MEKTIKNGTYDLEIVDVKERTSHAGRDYISLRLVALTDEGSDGQMYVNYMKEYPWSMDNLKKVLAACKVSRLGELTGKRLTAEVIVKNGFTNLWNPQPYTEYASDPFEDSDSGNEEEIPW